MKAPVFPAVLLIALAKATQQSEPVVLNPSPSSVKEAGSVAASLPKANVSFEVPCIVRMTIEPGTMTFIWAWVRFPEALASLTMVVWEKGLAEATAHPL